jgi:hypothetical protein
MPSIRATASRTPSRRISSNSNLGIRAIAQRHAAGAQFGGEQTVTIDLAVEDQRIAGHIVDARLGARKIDDR